MAEHEIHYLGDTVLRLCAHGEEQGQRQVIVHVRVSELFCDGFEGVFTVYPEVISSRFHLGHLSLSEALPSIVSIVASHLDAKKRQLCGGRLLPFALQAAAGAAIGSSLELFFDIGAFFSPGWLADYAEVMFSPGWLAEHVEVMADWMLETPLEVQEEYITDYHLQSFDGFGGTPASRSFINNLEPSPYGGGEGIREKQCVICLEDFDVEEQVTKMPCSHTFHNQCIIHWLEESHVCPICRHEMPTSSS